MAPTPMAGEREKSVRDYATLFSTRARARKAVERTTNYALANGLSWPVIDRSKVKITSARVEPARRGDVHPGR